MKVKMLTRIEGTRNGARWPVAGSVIDVTDAEAVGMIETGIAVPVKDEPERATARKSETRKR